MSGKKIAVIGSGFAGLSAACYLAKSGYDVTVLEKNSSAGGRARAFAAEGFTFDMGPSWYWMPDVFEKFFSDFGYKVSDLYELVRLDPSYKIFWGDDVWNVPADYEALKELFENTEAGAGAKLDLFLKEAAYKYDASINKLVYKPGLNIREFINWDIAKSLLKIDMLQSMHSHVRKYFKHPRLVQLTEFPVLFLGALPKNTPALYSMMNYADMKLGTWYPMGGMYKIAEAMYKLAKGLGVRFEFNTEVNMLNINNDKSIVVYTDKDIYRPDSVLSACDYEHTDRHLLPEQYSNYRQAYWDSRDMAPSCLLYYVGLNKKLKGLEHHNLFFDAPFEEHANEIYIDKKWPSNPLVYVCCPSVTDKGVAPEGCENLFILIPVAAGLNDNEQVRAQYFKTAVQRIEKNLGESITDAIVYRRSYAPSNFVAEYNAFKGNAYGLANTLKQTAILKPSIKNKKLPRLFYTGQLTVPGPGVPPSIISGNIVAKQMDKFLKTQKALNL